MVRVEMMAVGRELLIGRTVNTNAHWLGRRLALMGSMLARIETVDDDLVEISSSLKSVLRRHPDFLLVVGGLGPTPDDMTLQGIASGLHRKMVPSRPGLKLIREHYAETGRAGFRMTPARRKMAILPEGAEPLLNKKGTAPGVRIKEGETLVFCLPGVPMEMKDIFRRSVEPEIQSVLGQLFRVAARLRLEGIFESVLAPMIAVELKEHPGAYIKSHPRGIREGVSRIELDVVVVNRSRDRARSEVESIVDGVRAAIRRSGGRITYARGIGI